MTLQSNVAVICAMLCGSSISIGQEYGIPGYPIGGGAKPSFEWKGKDYIHNETYDAFPKAAHNPEDSERARLVVEWGEVIDISDERSKSSLQKALADIPEWLRPDPERQLVVAGQLRIASADGKTSRPIDWLQGVEVVIAREPNTKPDWGARHDTMGSTGCDCLIEKNGMFYARFNTAAFNRQPGRVDKFQVAICLAITRGNTITWTNASPVLPRSVASISLKGPAPLSPALKAINAAPSPVEADFDPVMLIRAVNHLHSLGKADAIAQLRSFMKIARVNPIPNHKRTPENIDTSDNQCVFLIVYLLFQPAAPQDRRLPLSIGLIIPSPARRDRVLWPLFPLYVQDDVPFNVANGVLLEGLAESPDVHIDWAEQHGKLRSLQLRPSDNPLDAVERFLALPQTARLEPDTGFLRRQAWRMIQSALQVPLNPMDFRMRDGYDADSDWENHKKLASKFRVRWDEKEQLYVAK